MATLILMAASAAGAATATAAATGVAAWSAMARFGATLLASWFDARFIMPSLLSSGDSKGRRLDDLRIQGAAEGDPMSLVFGENFRIQGHCIWKSPLIEHAHDEGGGCGGGNEITVYSYSVDADIAVCDNLIEEIDKIFFNGKVVYRRLTVVTVTGTTISLDRIEFQTSGTDPLGPFTALVDDAAVAVGDTAIHFDQVPRKGTFTPVKSRLQNQLTFVVSSDTQVYKIDSFTETYNSVTNDFDADLVITPAARVAWADNTSVVFGPTIASYTIRVIKSTSSSVNLANLVPGYDTVITGFTAGADNGTFRCLSSENLGGGISEATFRVVDIINDDDLDPVIEAAGNTITLTQTLPNIIPGTIDSVTIYKGTETQGADPLLESYLGTGLVPSYRGHAHAVLDGIQLQDFGNAFPNIEFLVREKTGRTVGEVIAAVLVRAGFSASEYSVTGLTAVCKGFGVVGPQSTSQVLQSLIVAYNLVAYDDNGVLTFKDRATLSARAISETKLGAYMDRPEHDPFEIADAPDDELMKAVQVRYQDPENNHQSGSQMAQKVHHSSDSPAQIELPIAMTPQEARGIAERMLWTMHANRHHLTISLPPSEIALREAELLQFNEMGQVWKPLTQRIDRGDNWIIECEGVHEEPGPMTWTTGPGESGNSGVDSDGEYPPEPVLVFIDAGPLKSSHEQLTAMYLAVFSPSNGTPWTGALVYFSRDNVTYNEYIEAPKEATGGYAKTVLASSSASAGWWDRKNTVDVQMQNGQFTTASEIDVLNGANRMLLGGEVIAFQTATLVGARTYRLSTLLRGLRNTESALVGHQKNESAVYLNGPGIMLATVELTDVDETIYYKAVPNGGPIANYPPVADTSSASCRRCFSPAHVTGTRNAANDDILIDWVYRSRGLVRILSSQGAPQLENPETYEIDIYDAGVFSTTITVTGATSYNYPAAAQTTDGLVAGDPLDLDIYQISSALGRGLGNRIVV